MICRRLLLILLSVIPFAFACHRGRPNVLVITIDTCRADHIGCYGFALAHTPNIDRLAGEGVRCANAAASAPITMPSHSSIFTGLYPPAHGVRDNGSYQLGDDAVTLAERLRAAGYTTHAFVSAFVLSRRYNLSQGFETYDDDLWSEDEPKMFMIRERPASKTANRVITWLDQWKRGKNRKPFFTWVHFFDPHQPYRPPPRDLTLARSPYDAEIASVDRQIGRIVERLKEEGVLDDTIVVITADHGESLGEHGERTHAIFVYNATVHVPLIWRYPRGFAPRVYDGPVRHVDIVPTLLALLDLPGGDKTQGVDLTEALRGRKAAPDLAQYSESLLSEVGFGMAPLHALRHGQYKYIRAPRPELYDMAADPNERKNIYEQRRDVAAKLDRELSIVLDDSRKHEVHSTASPMSRETQESLQALGYLAPAGQREAMGGIDPKDGIVIYEKLETARHYAQHEKWDEARRVLNEVITATPKNLSAINVLGVVELKAGNIEAAQKEYFHSLALDPNQFRVYGVLGAIELGNLRLPEAERYFHEALKVNPAFAEAMANLGFIEALRGHEKKAEEWYNRGIAADPLYPQVQRRLGDLYYDAQDYQRAYANYKQVITVTPSDFRATVQAGNSARRLGHVAEASALFAKAQRIRSESWIPAYNEACLMAVSGRQKEAITSLRKAIHLGFASVEHADDDPDLATIRALPEWRTLRARIVAAKEGEGTDVGME